MIVRSEALAAEVAQVLGASLLEFRVPSSGFRVEPQTLGAKAPQVPCSKFQVPS